MKNTLFLVIATLSICSAKGQTYYRGLERMCWTSSKGKIECYDSPRKWYHENTILIEGDSIFIYKVPLHIVKGRKLYSASDGALYYYYGIIKQIGVNKIAYMTRYNCDYCGQMIRVDTLTGYRYPLPSTGTLRLEFEYKRVKVENVIYDKVESSKLDYFPAKPNFYLDSNSISRINPLNQYKLISRGIKSFLQTKELKLDNDTLRICTNRFAKYKGDELIETLDPSRLKIDTTGVVFKYYSRSEIDSLLKHSTKPIRAVEIEEIIEYWKAARISLVYRIFLPEKIHNFSERQYNNTFGYEKTRQGYEHSRGLPENSWGLVEKK